MTKFKIFAPSGIEVCTIEAVSKVSTVCATLFYDRETDLEIQDTILELPEGWIAIPENIIVKNENEKPAKIPSFEEAVKNSKLLSGEL